MKLPWIILILLIALLPLFSIDIGLNGRLRETYTSEELDAFTYLIPKDSGFEKGISLDEILPLTTGAYRVKAWSGHTQKSWEADDIAEKIHKYYLVRADFRGTWDLLIDDEVFKDVRRLDLWGDPLTQNHLEVWVSWEGVPLLKKEITRFAQLHKVTIKTVEVPKTESKLISVLRGRGKLPDVVMIQSDYLPSLTRARALQNLDYMIAGALVEKGLEAFRLNGKRWGIPFYYDTQLVFYNKKLIPEAPSPDWTLQDMERIAYRLASEKGIIPITWNAYSAYWLIPFQIGFGKKSIVLPDGSIRINDSATEKALNYILDLKKRGLLRIMERDAMISLFISGKIGMIFSGSYSIPLFNDLGIDFDIAPYPFNSAAEKSISPLLDFKAWAITRKTHNPILARRLIQYLTGTGVQQRFCITLSKLPADKSTWKIIKDENPYYPVLAQSSEIGTPVPPDRSYAVYKGTMWKLLHFVLSGQMSIKEVLAKGQEIIDARLKQGW